MEYDVPYLPSEAVVFALPAPGAPSGRAEVIPLDGCQPESVLTQETEGTGEEEAVMDTVKNGEGMHPVEIHPTRCSSRRGGMQATQVRI